MQFVVPLIVILTFLVIIGIRVQKHRNLMKKREEYEKKLREAKVTRYQYMQALQQSRDILADIEEVEEKLTSVKAELIGYHSDIRQQVDTIRKHRKKSTGSDLDNRTQQQMEAELARLWAHTDSRKLVCLDIEEAHHKLMQNKKRLEHEELKVTNRWFKQKDNVIKVYDDLKNQLSLTDPRKSFS